MFKRLVDMYVYTFEYQEVILAILKRAGFKIEECECEEGTHLIYADSAEDIAMIDELIKCDVV